MGDPFTDHAKPGSSDCGGAPPLSINIGEAARLIGVSAATLRAWERRGLIAVERSRAGYRRFTLGDIENLRQIRRAATGDALTSETGIVRRTAADDEVGRGARPAQDAPWGQRLRRQREARGLSLRQVAARTGLSASYISGIERGLARPSVAALQKLTAACGASIVDLMAADATPRGRLVRLADRQRYDPAAGVVMDQLNFGNHVMELHLFTVEPGAGTGGAFAHEGEEFILLLEGTLHVLIDGIELYVLEPSDVLYFESWRRHEWTNPGPDTAVFLGVNTPRTF